MPYASRRDPDDLEGLAAALDALVGTDYEEQVFIWVDGTPEGHSLDVVHSTDDVEGDAMVATPDLVLPTGAPPPDAVQDTKPDDDDGNGDDVDDWDDDEWDEPDGSTGRYLVYIGYAPGAPFAERDVPVPAGTVLLDDDGTGATVALPDLPVAAVIELLGAWARAVLGGAAIGGLWWATTFGDDDADDQVEIEVEIDDATGPARNGDAGT